MPVWIAPAAVGRGRVALLQPPTARGGIRMAVSSCVWAGGTVPQHSERRRLGAFLQCAKRPDRSQVRATAAICILRLVQLVGREWAGFESSL